ncbi:TPA: hypothetical protein ACH3X1_013126 [Trebouxia sp. C0004]
MPATALLGRLQSGTDSSSKSVQRALALEHLSQRIRANNIVLHGVPDIAAHSRPADLTRYVSNKPGAGKRAVLVEFSTHTAKHEAFKLSRHVRRSGLHLADELTPKQLKAQKGLEADFSALKLKGFHPFYRRGELKASPAPPRPPRRGPAPGCQGVRTSLPGHSSPGSTAGGGPAPGQRAASCAAAASTSAAIAAANAAPAAAATPMAGNGDIEMPAPSPGPGTGPSALARSQ